MKPNIYGLLLVGGKSRRMGRDKALISYDGSTSQLDRTAELLGLVCEKVYISQRKEQKFITSHHMNVIYDSEKEVMGPLRGMLSAMRTHQNVHWLVLACDLPFLKLNTLEKLVRKFSVQPQLTAYRSSHDGLPEPLCAIYPAGCYSELHLLSKQLGNSCPRKLLIIKKAHLITLDDTRSLDNINTTKEYTETLKRKKLISYEN